ncbi:MAG: PaaI family thioesterase [Pseudomonadota bacterium]
MLKMDAAALQAFLETDFIEVSRDFHIDRVDETGISVRLQVSDKHLRPGGTISGPSMFGLADVSVYLAILSRIGPVALTVTTNCSIDFMRKPQAGKDLVCDTRLLKLGRVLAVGDCLIHSDGTDAPVARATLTYSIPPA